VTLRLPSEPLSAVRFQSVLQPVALQKLPFSDRRPHPQADHVCSVPIAVMLASHDSSRALPFADVESIENHPCTTCLGATLLRHVRGCSWQHACSATARAISRIPSSTPTCSDDTARGGGRMRWTCCYPFFDDVKTCKTPAIRERRIYRALLRVPPGVGRTLLQIHPQWGLKRKH